MSEEKRLFDTEDNFEMLGARLAKDPQVREGQSGKMVTLTFVSTSRNEGDSDLWVTANVADRQAEMASFLKQGDILHQVAGKPCLSRFGENNEKISFKLRRASFVPPNSLFAVLRERGWSPGGGTPTKPSARAPVKKPTARTKASMPDLDGDDDIPF